MIERRGFNSIIEDNEEQYYQLLDAIIFSLDEYASTTIVKSPYSVNIRISPSEPKYSQPLLREILSLHNLLQIELILSKSINSSSNVQYVIRF